MLRSKDNLLAEVKAFIAESSSVRVFSPFIRVVKLQQVLDDTKCQFIVVRWKANDLLQNTCDFEDLYEFCRRNDIALYRNVKVHLKAVLNDSDEIIYGSANFTNLGMGEHTGNWELAGRGGPLSPIDLLYFQRILRDSDLVDADYFADLAMKIAVLKQEYQLFVPAPELSIERSKKSAFLLSELPMSLSPDRFWDTYTTLDGNTQNNVDVDCAVHDIVNYQLPLGLSRDEFNARLRIAFNTHPFVFALKQAIRTKVNRYMGYTELTIWLAENTTSVPTPRRWDIRDSGHVNILHAWITSLDEAFISEKRYPNGSDRLGYAPV